MCKDSWLVTAKRYNLILINHTFHLEIIRLCDVEEVVTLSDLEFDLGSILINEGNINSVVSLEQCRDTRPLGCFSNLLFARLWRRNMAMGSLCRGRETSLSCLPPL